MKEYLKAKELLEGCSAKLSNNDSDSQSLDNGIEAAANSSTPSMLSALRLSGSKKVQRINNRSKRKVVIGDSVVTSSASRNDEIGSSFSSRNDSTIASDQALSFNSFNEAVSHDASFHHSPSIGIESVEPVEENYDKEVVLYDQDILSASSAVEADEESQCQYFDIVDESSDSDDCWMEMQELDIPAPFVDAEMLFDASNDADEQKFEDEKPQNAGSHSEIDWGIDPSDSLLIDPNDFTDVSVPDKAVVEPQPKPRYRYQTQTQQFNALDEVVSGIESQVKTVTEEEVPSSEEVYDEEAIISFNADEPQITIIRSSLTEQTSLDDDSGDVEAGLSKPKPKPTLFPKRKIDWDSFPVKAHHIDQASKVTMQASKATMTGLAAVGEAIKPMPMATIRAIAKPSVRLAQMGKQAYRNRSEIAIQRLVKSVECSKSAALKAVKDKFDLNQPCSGDFDKESLGYNQAYISEHNFKALVQLSSFSILIVLCASFTFNLWVAKDHGFGFRQQIIKDLAMINSETLSIEAENEALNRQINTFRDNEQAVESMVRYELGMIKPDETFIRIVN